MTSNVFLPSRFFSEAHDDAAETPTTPTNEGYRDTETETEPHIPEPDYDMSDVDNGDNHSYSGSESGSWRDATATLRRNSRNTTDRKKKKTVSFIMNEELANIIHSSGTMTKRDSILKDPSRDREDDGKGRSSSKSSKRSPTKVAPPMPETPKTPSEPTFKSFFTPDNSTKLPAVSKATSHPAWEGGSIMEPNSATAQTESKHSTVSKIRIEVGNLKTSTNGSSTLPRGTSIQKSQSFSADLSPVSGYKLKSLPKVEANTSNSGAISQADLQKAKMQLKSSRSFPELLEDGDNSSSGVSSDQDQDSVNIPCEHVSGGRAQGDKAEYVTKLTVSNGDRQRHVSNECESNSSQSEIDTSDRTWTLNNNTAALGTANTDNSVTGVKSGAIGKSNKSGSKSVTMTGPIGPVHIEWSSGGSEEHHYQNFATMMQHQRTRNLSRSVIILSLFGIEIVNLNSKYLVLHYTQFCAAM